VAVIKKGRPRPGPVPAEDDGWLRLRDRRTILASEISDRHFAALRETKVPDRFADLDVELEDWRP